jgi:hypothetical protein
MGLILPLIGLAVVILLIFLVFRWRRNQIRPSVGAESAAKSNGQGAVTLEPEALPGTKVPVVIHAAGTDAAKRVLLTIQLPDSWEQRTEPESGSAGGDNYMKTNWVLRPAPGFTLQMEIRSTRPNTAQRTNAEELQHEEFVLETGYDGAKFFGVAEGPESNSAIFRLNAFLTDRGDVRLCLVNAFQAANCRVFIRCIAGPEQNTRVEEYAASFSDLTLAAFNRVINA